VPLRERKITKKAKTKPSPLNKKEIL